MGELCRAPRGGRWGEAQMGLVQPPKVSFRSRKGPQQQETSSSSPGAHVRGGFSQSLIIGLETLRVVGTVRGHLCALLCPDSDCARAQPGGEWLVFFSVNENFILHLAVGPCVS